MVIIQLMDVISNLCIVTTKKALSQSNQPLPRGYWTMDEHKNVRAFFDNFASNRGFDPLVAINWYRYSSFDISREKVCLFVWIHLLIYVGWRFRNVPLQWFSGANADGYLPRNWY